MAGTMVMAIISIEVLSRLPKHGAVRSLYQFTVKDTGCGIPKAGPCIAVTKAKLAAAGAILLQQGP